MIVTPFDTLAELRFQRHVEYLHRVGPRALGEFLAEIGATRSCRTEIERRLARYANTNPEFCEPLAATVFQALVVRAERNLVRT